MSTNNHSRILDSFDLFLEKSNELKQSRFYDFIKQGTGINTHIEWSQNEGFSTFVQHPDEGAVKAFVLTLRFFIKPNESCSFLQIKKHLINFNVSKDILKNINKSYENLQEYLDETIVIYNGEPITNRKVLDNFLNGKYAHTDKNKRSVIDYWKKDECGYLLWFGNFCGILYNYMKLILHTADVIEKIKEHCIAK